MCSIIKKESTDIIKFPFHCQSKFASTSHECRMSQIQDGWQAAYKHNYNVCVCSLPIKPYRQSEMIKKAIIFSVTGTTYVPSKTQIDLHEKYLK